MEIVKSNIEIYCNILLDFLRFSNLNYDYNETEINNVKKLTKRLKFEHLYDFDLFRACIDQMEDAEYAIKEFNKNGLNSSLGEQYLRLYGVLNACYLQVGVLTELLRLFHFNDYKEIIKSIKSLKVIEIRNKIASHTTAYVENNKRTSYYKVAQSTLNKKGNDILIVGKDDDYSENINLPDIVSKFTKIVEKFMDQIVLKSFERNLRKDALEELKSQYNTLKK